MSTAPPITFADDRLSVRFDRFDMPAYDLFLRVKRLPEQAVEFDPETESYTVTAPARFASMLGVERPLASADALPFSPFLFDDQRAIVEMALDAKRFACWSGCGSGKTLISLEWARHVMHRTGGRVLIVTINNVVPQWIDERRKFFGDDLPIFRLTSREQMRCFMKGGLPDQPRLAVTNYEKWNPESLERQVVSEARLLAGVVLDENRIKTGGGKQKWALIKSCRGVEYKLSCTATPAPNDTIEFASQASFLEKMRSEGEIIWTYFARDQKTHRWTVKPHARKAFFEFMAGWSIYVNDPKRYGWRLDQQDVPAPTILKHEIGMTPEQAAFLLQFTTNADGQSQLVQLKDVNAIQRGKMSQVAKGFRYLKGEAAGKYERIASNKPRFVADLARSEVAAGLQALLWTTFNAETDLLAEQLSGLRFAVLTGKTDEEERTDILERFRRGDVDLLVSRASMLGWGMNFQFVGSMIFSGWTDSFEQYFQAIARAYRYGQTLSLRVHLPVVPDLELDQMENLFVKQDKHTASIADMEDNYIKASHRLRGVA